MQLEAGQVGAEAEVLADAEAQVLVRAAADLEGLRVVTVDGVELGTVSHLFATGANDVLVARDGERERMIPFVQPQYVTAVDFEAGVVTVDWDPEF